MRLLHSNKVMQCSIWRLVKGDGEIMEEIVTKDRHKQINKVGFVQLIISYDTTYTYCYYVRPV